MDYKLLVLLLAILFLILMMYREMTTLKDSLMDNVMRISDDFNDRSTSVLKDMNANIGRCIGHIKNVSTENLDQLKTITLLNNQNVKKIQPSCVFTEETVESEIPMSDAIERDYIFHKKDSDYYMSEDTAANKVLIPVDHDMVCEGDICMIPAKDIPVYEEDLEEVVDESVHSDNTPLNVAEQVFVEAEPEMSPQIEEYRMDDDDDEVEFMVVPVEESDDIMIPLHEDMSLIDQDIELVARVEPALRGGTEIEEQLRGLEAEPLEGSHEHEYEYYSTEYLAVGGNDSSLEVEQSAEPVEDDIEGGIEEELEEVVVEDDQDDHEESSEDDPLTEESEEEFKLETIKAYNLDELKELNRQYGLSLTYAKKANGKTTRRSYNKPALYKNLKKHLGKR